MQSGISRSAITEKIILAGLVLLVVGLPLSRFLMSVSQFVLIAGWLLAPGLGARLRAAAKFVPLLLLGGLFLLHLAGMLYSSDIAYGLKDMRIKLPLLIFPLVLATIPPLSASRGKGILWVFAAATFISTLVSYAVLWGFTSIQVENIRDISPLISHIRLSLLVCCSIYALAWAIMHSRYWLPRVVMALAVGWFVVFLFTLESLTGLIILTAVTLICVAYTTFRKAGMIWGSFVVMFMVFAMGSVAKIFQAQYNESFKVNVEELAHLADTTARGGVYTHDLNRMDVENGNLVFIHMNWLEMEQAWGERSTMAFDGKDKRGQEVRFTLLRFLSAKGARKDYQAVMQMTPDEIMEVEMGHTSPGHGRVSDMGARIREVMWEIHNYRMHGTHGGHSVMQRWMFWQTSLEIIKSHPWTGVGTGDVMQAYEHQYATAPTTLEKRWQLRSHNQYLAFAVAFGIPGLLFFLITLIAPMFLLSKQHSFMYVTFLITAMLSMIAEDTLETQAGVTFYAFFNAFYLFVIREETEVSAPFAE